jgi:hypothetical protein
MKRIFMRVAVAGALTRPARGKGGYIMKYLFTTLLLLICAHSTFAQLSGPLSGTLGPGTFRVIDTVWVNPGDSLLLSPGTTLSFDGPYPFWVYGSLLAEGIEGDSVLFTCDTTLNPDRWRGLRFFNPSSSGSRLVYCIVETGDVDDCGGAIFCWNSSPSLSNCSLRKNTTDGDGGAMCCENSSSPFLTHCVISHNSAENGGGLFCSESSLSLEHCDVMDNSARSDGGGVACEAGSVLDLSHCTIIGNSAVLGGGINCNGSSLTSVSCTVSDNSAVLYGGGVNCEASSPNFSNCAINENAAADGGGVNCDEASPIFVACTIEDNTARNCGGALSSSSGWSNFTDCVISGNSADAGGGAVVSWSNSVSFTSCEINRNSAAHGNGGAVWSCICSDHFENCIFQGNSAFESGVAQCDGSSSSFVNCTLVSNSAECCGIVNCESSSLRFISNIVAFSNAPGIYFASSLSCSVRFCNVFGNVGGDIFFEDNDASNGPPNLGQLVTTNANGDSCDIYYNIFLDPMFVDTAAGDYHLLAGSPCIDAGDPALPLDPDNTIADIGAFYFHQLAAEPVAVLTPKSFALHPNWPNPFNSTTMIRYDVPQACKVSLTIFNLLGQRVATPFDGRQIAGSYAISWDAGHLPSGVYLCRMDAAGFVQTRKMVLVK